MRPLRCCVCWRRLRRHVWRRGRHTYCCHHARERGVKIRYPKHKENA